MNSRELKALVEKLKGLDAKSKAFFEIYKTVSEKYWDIPKPNVYQQSAAMLVKFAERGDPAQVSIASKVVIELYNLEKENKDACKMKFECDNGDHFVVDIYKDGIARDSLEKMIGDAARAINDGKVTFKDGTK